MVLTTQSTISDEIISGRNFPQWVQKYNESGIITKEIETEKEKVVYTSDLERSFATGKLIGEKIIQNPIFREAEIPLIKFPGIQFKAKIWLFISRSLWFLGLNFQCESFKGATQRAKQIIENIELLLSENQRIVIIGHGLINRLIKRELLRNDWVLKSSKVENQFLSEMTFQSKPKL